jgi:hypothetical protein
MGVIAGVKEFVQQSAHFVNRRYYLLAGMVTLFACGIVFFDLQTRFVEAVLPFRMIKDVGKSAGAFAVFLAIVSMSYYGIRDLYSLSRRVKIVLPRNIDEWVKYVITVLRLAHPFVGTIVFSVVLVHGYVMWRIWAGGNFNYSVESGLVAAAMLMVLAFSGLLIRWMPKMLKLRHVHRMVGGAFLISLIIHKIIE